MNTNKQIKTLGRQQGMTLIELAVVLLVLIGLAGLAIPYVTGFIGKTHNSTSADSGASLASSLQQYASLKGGYPQNLDSLMSDASTLVTDLDDHVFTGGKTTFGTVTTTTKNIIPSLNAAGILSVAWNSAGSQSLAADGTPVNTINPTFDPAVTLNQLVSAQTKLATSADANGAADGGLTIYKLFYPAATTLPANTNVVVFGVGQSNSAVGTTLTNVPVHFGDTAFNKQNVTYGRFLAAFLVDSSTPVAGTPATPAQFLGIVHAPDTNDRWESLGSSISNF